jgi:hypothetical protein
MRQHYFIARAFRDFIAHGHSEADFPEQQLSDAMMGWTAMWPRNGAQIGFGSTSLGLTALLSAVGLGASRHESLAAELFLTF